MRRKYIIQIGNRLYFKPIYQKNFISSSKFGKTKKDKDTKTKYELNGDINSDKMIIVKIFFENKKYYFLFFLKKKNNLLSIYQSK